MSAEVVTPYTVSEVAVLTGLSARTVTKLFEGERGVIVKGCRIPAQAGELPDHPHPPVRLCAGHAALHALS